MFEIHCLKTKQNKTILSLKPTFLSQYPCVHYCSCNSFTPIFWSLKQPTQNNKHYLIQFLRVRNLDSAKQDGLRVSWGYSQDGTAIMWRLDQGWRTCSQYGSHMAVGQWPLFLITLASWRGSRLPLEWVIWEKVAKMEVVISFVKGKSKWSWYCSQSSLKWSREASEEVWLIHISAWKESELLTTYCLNKDIQDICQKLKILIGLLP